MLNISESVSRAMIDINVLAGLIACGENGAIVHCNQEAAVFCGYGVDEMRQLNLLDIFHSSTNNQGLSQFHNILEDKFGSYSIEVEASRKDRVVTKAAISGMRCTWNNQPADLIYLQDYNGYKSLKEFVRIQSTMLESITDPIVVINTGGSIVYLNAANCRLTGYTREEILGHNSFEIFHPEFHEQWLAIVQMQLSRDKYSGPVLPIKNKDGLLINVMGHTSPLFDEKGQIIGRICFTVKSQEENPLANRSSETLILISEPNSSPPNPGTQEKPAGQEGSFVFLPQLHIKCLGGLEVRSAKQEIHYLNSCRGREVLEFMLTRYQGPVRRDKLIEALWPEFTPAAASNNLKVAVHHLRTELNQILGYDKHFPSIFFSNGCYALDVRIVLSIDVAEFENHWARGRFLESQGQRESAILEFTKAEALYRGDFLDINKKLIPA